MTTLQAGSATVVGQVRAANEDSHLVLDELVVVADGMGGHRGGAVASATTVRVAASITEMVPSPQLATKTVPVLGSTATPTGRLPTVTVPVTRYEPGDGRS